jgi:hypothetical protein
VGFLQPILTLETKTMANGRDGGSGAAIILAVVVVLLVVVVLWVTGVFGGRQADTGTDINVDINTPTAPRPGN